MEVVDSISQDAAGKTLMGHPRGLFLLFLVEMWERFSYYGMRALLVLYLVHESAGLNPGRGWSKADASNLYGWYTGLAYLLPLVGGIIADKFIGTHRSMVIGSIVIAMGHVALAISGFGSLVHSELGMSVFVMGLALIIVGTGHFKPTVSVMVGQLYARDDPRRDGAFTIFYMGINVGAFICAFVCGTLGEKIGWHWGFGSAAVGMILGLFTYLLGKPVYLKDVGSPPDGKPNYSPWFVLAAIIISAAVAMLYYAGFFTWIERCSDLVCGTSFAGVIPIGVTAVVIVWSACFIRRQAQDDRGPTACILMFIIFNAFFWLAFEQAGSSLNFFADEKTNRWITLPAIGLWEMPATWFQSVNPLLIILFGPVFAALWPWLARCNRNPSQPMKIAIALLLVGAGYIFMVVGAMKATPVAAKAGMFWLLATYTLHTLGELCISPTGLSFVTRAAPVRLVSFLMGIWFLSSFVANKLGGTVAAQIEKIEHGQINLFWYRWFKLGGQADFFLMFVISSITAGVIVLLMTPWLKRLLHGRE